MVAPFATSQPAAAAPLGQTAPQPVALPTQGYTGIWPLAGEVEPNAAVTPEPAGDSAPPTTAPVETTTVATTTPTSPSGPTTTGPVTTQANSTDQSSPASADENDDASVSVAPAPSFDPVRVARGYLSENQARIGIVADTEFTNPEFEAVGAGGYVVRFDQSIEDVPVFAGGAAVRLDDNGGLLSIASNTAGVVSTEAQPAVDAATATATATVNATNSFIEQGVSTAAVTASQPTSTIYDPSMIGGDPNAEKFDAPVLAWDVTVTATDDMAMQRVLVDATTGEVLLSYSNEHTARNRSICDAANSVTRTLTSTCYRFRGEGGPATGIADADDAYNQAGFFYDFFRNRFGRDSWNGRGAVMETITRGCIDERSCPDRNAGWYGAPFNLIVVGENFVKDDVIFHEWTHAITDSTADLMYYAESGAINESMSDVFGELLDQAYNPSSGNGHDSASSAWLIGEDVPGGPIRSMKNPSAYKDPDRMRSGYYFPRQGEVEPAADNWGVHINSGVNNKAAYLIAAGGSFNGQTVTGIGNSKTAALYYEVLTGLLTPGSDYLDLYYALPRACDNLVKLRKLGAADCNSVRKAVLATEMNLAETQRKTAAECPSGRAFDQYTADAESAMSLVVAAQNAPTFRPSNRGSVQGRSSYWLPAPAGISATQLSWMRTRYPIYISTQSPAYLTFSHSYDFQYDTDGRRPARGAKVGGVVQYSIDGKNWSDLGATRGVVNGYNGSISDPTNPLNNRNAFVFKSKGFEEVRIPVTFLKGKMVQFRWLFATNNAIGASDGWLIDDISVHTCGSTAPTDTVTNPGRFTPVAPRRLFDTRDNRGTLRSVPTAKRTPNSVLAVDLTDLGVFAYGDEVTAVALNLTGVGADRNGYIAAYPCGSSSDTSTVNVIPGSAVANSAIIPLSADGRVCFKTSGNVNVLADVTGYFSNTRRSASTYKPINPKRIFDTRDNSKSLMKVTLGKRNPGQVIKVPIKKMALYAKGDTPTAVAVNVTTAGAEGTRYVTAYPCANGVPNTSTVNPVTYSAVTNSAIIPIDKNGDICVRVAERTNVVLDITGYFAAGGQGHRFAPVTPKRVIDTRRGQQSANPKITGTRGANSTTTVPFGTLGLFGNRKPVAVAANFTAVKAAGGGFLASWPCGTTQPDTSISNYVSNTGARASSTLVQLGGGRNVGNACVFTRQRVDILADITGYFY